MNERIRNGFLSSVVFGLSFSIFQLILSIDLSPWLFPDSLTSSLFLLLIGALIVGSIVGKTFEIILNDQSRVMASGVWSSVLVAGVLLPLVASFSTLIYFSVRYVADSVSPENYSPNLRSIFAFPPQIYGLVVGALVGLVIGTVFGKGTGQLTKITLWTALGFALGGFLMGWIAPIDTYLGPFNPHGPVMYLGPVPRETVSIFLIERMLGGALFGALGGATLGYYVSE